MSNCPLTAELVAAAYRVILGREPESRTTVQDHIANCKTVDVFFERLIHLPDFTWAAQRSLSMAVQRPRLHGRVDVNGSAADMNALMAHTREVWHRYGEEEPYYSVLTHEKYRGKAIAGEIRNEFYASGAGNCEAFFRICSKNGLVPNEAGVALDFGCGLGRIGEHLSARFARYIGVDISASHLKQAQARFSEIGRTNGTLRLLPDFLDRPDLVDVVYSVIVLQHNPPPVIAMLIAKLCSVLRPGGILSFQVPVGLFGYAFDLSKYLKTPPTHGRMEMHCIPQRHVYRILDENNCQVVEAFPDGVIGQAGLSYTFLAVKK